MSDDPRTEDAFVAWASAGVDQSFCIFKLYTRKLVNNAIGESGQFDLDCRIPLINLEESSDPVGLLKRYAREYIAHAVQSTGIPREYWILEFSPVMERYNVPSHLFLDTSRDRAWLA